ncbi:hypothetical protein B0G62_102271 [Paraburkholderia eburnea]|uniref:DUF2964 family protein n=1 Tax=Paraburkholderia eburnea TaxID=1189126 RepID=A0A2S4MIT6_9BURK|nr:hypothetical protein [Paraburkholderia eburnea]POR54663.1 hypothetical protein B0G62_102271 [Paraburkholderia eburnea]PRZ24737.1 hypothetical protein BX588_103458 [Paraburkholderia eburnea]
MIFDRLRAGAGPERRHRVWTRLRILVAAIGTLGSATGIAIAVIGLVEFNHAKVVTGALVIIVSTAVYVSILVRDRDRVD